MKPPKRNRQTTTLPFERMYVGKTNRFDTTNSALEKKLEWVIGKFAEAEIHRSRLRIERLADHINVFAPNGQKVRIVAVPNLEHTKPYTVAIATKVEEPIVPVI